MWVEEEMYSRFADLKEVLLQLQAFGTSQEMELNAPQVAKD